MSDIENSGDYNRLYYYNNISKIPKRSRFTLHHRKIYFNNTIGNSLKISDLNQDSAS